MGQLTDFTVYDGAATPVAHIMTGISVSREANVQIAEYRELSTTLPIEAQITCTLTKQLLKNGITRISERWNVPVMETVGAQNAAGYTAAPKVAYVDTFDVVAYVHPRSTTAGRRLCRMLAVNASNDVSTPAAASTTGQIPQLVDDLIFPT